jgi:DNA-binding GntR family transcriptional regulator
MPTGPIRSSEAVQQAYAFIRARIMSGEYESGRRLVEDELALVTGVSRTPVREALNLLRTEGLVDAQARRGARVAWWSAEDLDELYGLRAQLEGYGARLATERISPADIDGLEELCVRMERTLAQGGIEAINDIAELNNAFHGMIFRATGNRRLIGSLATIVEVPLVHHAMRRYASFHLPRSFSDHRELVAALRARDPDLADAVMRAHILSGRAALAHAPIP